MVFIASNTLTVFLEGRIDTTNAPEIEKELMDAVADACLASIHLNSWKL